MLEPMCAPLSSPHVLVLLLGVAVQEGEDAFGNKDSYGTDSEDSDDDESLARTRFTIRTGALDEKVAAIETLGIICTAVGEPVMPYLEKIVVELDELTEYPHNFIREAVLKCFNDIFGLCFTVFPNQTKPTPGVATPMHPTTAAICAKIVPLLIQRMREDEEKEVVAAACEAMYEVCKNFGLGVIQNHIDELFSVILELAAEKSCCQTAYEEDDPENTEHDEVLIDSVTDVIGVLATIVGDNFEPIFRLQINN
jgi:hypothetical protein